MQVEITNNNCVIHLAFTICKTLHSFLIKLMTFKECALDLCDNGSIICTHFIFQEHFVDISL